MCEAEVGDEQTFEDPTVKTPQGMVAELLGKEAALFPDFERRGRGTAATESLLHVVSLRTFADCGDLQPDSHPTAQSKRKKARRDF